MSILNKKSIIRALAGLFYLNLAYGLVYGAFETRDIVTSMNRFMSDDAGPYYRVLSILPETGLLPILCLGWALVCVVLAVYLFKGSNKAWKIGVLGLFLTPVVSFMIVVLTQLRYMILVYGPVKFEQSSIILGSAPNLMIYLGILVASIVGFVLFKRFFEEKKVKVNKVVWVLIAGLFGVGFLNVGSWTLNAYREAGSYEYRVDEVSKRMGFLVYQPIYIPVGLEKTAFSLTKPEQRILEKETARMKIQMNTHDSILGKTGFVIVQQAEVGGNFDLKQYIDNLKVKSLKSLFQEVKVAGKAAYLQYPFYPSEEIKGLYFLVDEEVLVKFSSSEIAAEELLKIAESMQRK